MSEEMTPQRWAELDALFDEALSLTPSERAAFMARVDLERPQLAPPLRELLAADEGASGLDEPARALKSTLEPGQSVGAWRLIKELGRGGMGRVFLARHQGKDFELLGALKLMREDFSRDASLVERFKAERQVLARISDHSNIASILDGGVSEQGVPFLVMEYVDGPPLDLWADEQTLSLSERLKLFAQVCDAVDYLHQRLIIHRDIKPANILVWRGEQIKLLDFGVAKALEPWAGLDHHETQRADRLMTPAWASPEQLRGDPLTTASDVYALGLVLYVLLMGELPWDGQERSWSELVAQRQAPVSPLSQRLAQLEPLRLLTLAQARQESVHRLRAALRGDLEAIVERALRPEPEHRYGSARELVQDVRAYLSGQEVAARRGSWWYGASRAMRRYKLALVVISLLLGFAGVYVWTLQAQAIELKAQRDVAEREAIKSKRLSAFLVKMLAGADPSTGKRPELTVREVLDEGAALFTSELADEPEARAQLELVMASAYLSLGAWERAERHLDSARDYGLREGKTTGAIWIRATVALGKLREQQGQGPQSLRLLEQALVQAQASQDPERLSLEAEVQEALGHYYLVVKLSSIKSRAHFERAQQLWQQLEGVDGLSQTRALRGLATLTRSLEQPQEALKLYDRVLKLQRKSLPAQHPEIASTLHEISYAHPDPATRLKLRQEALEAYRATYGPKSYYVAELLNDVALELEFQGLKAQSIEHLRRAVELYAQLFAPDHPRRILLERNLGAVLRDAGRLDEAEPWLKGAYERELRADRTAVSAASASNLSLLYTEQGRWDEALRLNQEAMSLLPERIEPDRRISILWARRAIILGKMERWALADEALERAHALLPARLDRLPVELPVSVAMLYAHRQVHLALTR